MIRYAHPPQVQLSYLYNRPLLSTRQGGNVALDATLLELWQSADGRSLDEMITGFHARYATPGITRTALACLAEAGLLERVLDSPEDMEKQRVEPAADHHLSSAGPSPMLSAVIVNYNSLEWLKECIPSLLAQTYANIQIIVVDNGSHDGALEWLETNSPEITRLQIDRPASLAHAINAGAALASPESYLLMLNPDVRLEPETVNRLISVVQSEPQCAAVAAKLIFSWAPTFLNGLGNQVSSFSWGTDIAIGHLDLGQFDAYHELPSACFAAALITPKAWRSVGPLDEGFPMYYEDVEWCYRARLSGFKVLAAPKAIVYHAFGGTMGPSGHSEGLTPPKLSNVVYGRLHFALKLLKRYLARFLRNYIIEDVLNSIRYISTGNFGLARAYLTGWRKFLKALPALLSQRRLLQTRRKVSDDDLFAVQRNTPLPMVWNGLPELTWDLVIDHYYPLISGNRTRSMPEFSTHHDPHLLVVSTGESTQPAPIIEQLLQNLAGRMDITVATPLSLTDGTSMTSTAEERGSGNYQRVSYSPDRPKSLQLLIDNSVVAILPGNLVSGIPSIEYSATRLIIHLPSSTSPQQDTETMDRMLSLGDYFICTSSQRDFWLDALKARGRTGMPVEYEIEPITCYCLEGGYAPDRNPRPVYSAPPPPPPTGRLALVIYVWRKDGFRAMLHRTRRYIVKRLTNSQE